MFSRHLSSGIELNVLPRLSVKIAGIACPRGVQHLSVAGSSLRDPVIAVKKKLRSRLAFPDRLAGNAVSSAAVLAPTIKGVKSLIRLD